MKEIPTEIRSFIKSNGIMTLATSDGNPWVCTLYYGTDTKLNMYLVTDPESKHGLLIEKNPNVAFNIYDSHTKVTASKKGIQGLGVCTQVTDWKEAAQGLLLWHKSNPGNEARLTIEAVKKWRDTKIYKITPTFLKFFNKDLYGKDEYGIWDSSI